MLNTAYRVILIGIRSYARVVYVPKRGLETIIRFTLINKEHIEKKEYMDFIFLAISDPADIN